VGNAKNARYVRELPSRASSFIESSPRPTIIAANEVSRSA
jgi:hypothetical protein